MELLLHHPDKETSLSDWYRRACRDASELYIVTAYLTAWDTSLELGEQCKSFRLIVGKDFGITRKAACLSVMKWLPAARKSQFLVADAIGGFHPKALFWKEGTQHFAVIGSSNLSTAAFETNYEANIVSPISKADFAAAKEWVRDIERRSVVVSQDWLSSYTEAKKRPGGSGSSASGSGSSKPIKPLWLPKPRGSAEIAVKRRNQIGIYREYRKRLLGLARRCAAKTISDDEFYTQLPKYWSEKIGDRLQGRGWERLGKGANFQELSASLLNIIAAPADDRDDAVTRELDYLHSQKNSARTALLSELLCLEFPDLYPVVNKPVDAYLKAIKFTSPRGASEGAKYIDLARKLRLSLLVNSKHPAKSLAELDAVIWLAYGKEAD